MFVVNIVFVLSIQYLTKRCDEDMFVVCNYFRDFLYIYCIIPAQFK